MPFRKLTNRWTLLLVGFVFVLTAIGALGPGSYFLQHDTAHQHTTAIDLATNVCWGTGGKPMVSLILALPYALFGANPLWETLLLSLFATLALVALSDLTARLTGSPRWATLGVLWFLSLPTILFYTRYHIGHPLAFFIMGIWLHSRQRPGWAGLVFGMAITSHPNFLVPVASWLAWSGLLSLVRRDMEWLKKEVRLVAGLLVPVLMVVGVYFLFFNRPLGWMLGNAGTIDRLSNPGSGGTSWTHLWHIFRSSNGWLNTLLIASGLAYPLVRRPRVDQMDEIYLTGWSVVAAFTVYLGLQRAIFVPHMMSGVYPLLMISSVFTLKRLAAHRLAGGIPRQGQRALAALVILVFANTYVNNVLDGAVGSRTAYPTVDRVMADAAAAGLPVRYFGNVHVANVYSLLHGVETGINESSLDIVSGDTRAVLIFESKPRFPNTTLSDVLADERIDPASYIIITYPHMTGYRPSLNETRASTAYLRQSVRQPHARQEGADTSEIQVWWPRQSEGTFVARQVVDSETGEYILHYPGSGCNSPKRYGYGTQNYYDVIAENVLELIRGRR